MALTSMRSEMSSEKYFPTAALADSTHSRQSFLAFSAFSLFSEYLFCFCKTTNHKHTVPSSCKLILWFICVQQNLFSHPQFNLYLIQRMVNIYIEFYISINKKMIWDHLKFNRPSFVVNIQENEICDHCEIYYDLRVMSSL